jgi:hypothetical protein
MADSGSSAVSYTGGMQFRDPLSAVRYPYLNASAGSSFDAWRDG